MYDRPTIPDVSPEGLFGVAGGLFELIVTVKPEDQPLSAPSASLVLAFIVYVTPELKE